MCERFVAQPMNDFNALTGCEKCNGAYDRIAYCKYCPENGDCLRISNIICRMQMIWINVFYFRSHDCSAVSTTYFAGILFWLIWCRHKTRYKKLKEENSERTNERTHSHSTSTLLPLSSHANLLCYFLILLFLLLLLSFDFI